MDRSTEKLLADFHAGKISRRQLLQALGLAAVALPAGLIGQQAPAAGRAGGGGGGRAGGGPAAPTAPIARPFADTGWKTVWLDKLEYECVDAQAAAAFYVALMDWEVRSVEGDKILLDIGENSGGIEIRGGMTGPPPAAITDAGLGVNNRPPVRARFTGFAWGIDNWDATRVKAALQQRGLNPVEDNGPVDPATGVPAYQSFRVKDPMGFDVAITNGNKANRRTRANARLSVPLPFEPTGWKTLYLDHISFEVSDFRKSAGFYAALLGWNVRDVTADASDVNVTMGDGGLVGGAIIRGNAAARAAAAAARGGGAGGGGRGGGAGGVAGGGRAAAAAPAAPAAPSAAIGHISWGIADWNTERMKYEFIKRGVVYTNQQGVKEPRPDFTGSLQSYHVPDAMGWDLQIGNKIGPSTWG
jgi:catechol 2,3-dioxygenase-like lactoylglutathione lyase family enzyme